MIRNMQAWCDDNELKLAVRVDSQWTKGPERKSTRGRMILTSGTAVKQCSRTEATRASSVAESEFHTTVTGAEGLGMQALLPKSRAEGRGRSVH